MTTSPGVVFGISGSISAYKSLDIIRKCRSFGLTIVPVLSESAHRFVTPWSVSTLAEAPLIEGDMHEGAITHLMLGDTANLMVVCPASANTMAKLACGMANDLLSATVLSFKGTVMLFPAMHTEMWANPITQANVIKLKERGMVIIDPDVGALACGDTGAGRLPDPGVIAQVIYAHATAHAPLTNKRITITCGGTSEPIDTVRQITNTSSGRLGHAIANIAAGFGAKVRLIRSIQHPTLATIDCIDVQTAKAMADVVLDGTPCDALIMAAAVSDFTVDAAPKKQPRGSHHQLTLKPTSDILAAFNQKKPPNCTSIGFCLTDAPSPVAVGQEKLSAKGCDVMVVNGPEAFGKLRRNVHVLTPTTTIPMTNCPIEALACTLLGQI